MIQRQQREDRQRNLRRASDGWAPSMKQVQAALDAWNIAEPDHTIVHSTSYIATFNEILVAAHEVTL